MIPDSHYSQYCYFAHERAAIMLFLLNTGPKFCSLLEKGFLILITADIVMLLMRGPMLCCLCSWKGFWFILQSV